MPLVIQICSACMSPWQSLIRPCSILFANSPSYEIHSLDKVFFCILLYDRQLAESGDMCVCLCISMEISYNICYVPHHGPGYFVCHEEAVHHPVGREPPHLNCIFHNLSPALKHNAAVFPIYLHHVYIHIRGKPPVQGNFLVAEELSFSNGCEV